MDKKISFKDDIVKKPISYIILFTIFAIGFVMFPTNLLENFVGIYWSVAILRTLFLGVGITLMVMVGYVKPLKGSITNKKHLCIFVCAVIIAFNNAPLVAIFTKNITFSTNVNGIIGYVFYCITSCFFEEIFFRGLLLTTFLLAFKDKKHGVLLALICSSVLFSLMHLFNIFGGASVGAVLFQVMYTFFLGLLFGVVYLTSGSIYSCFLVHTIYNIGGLMIGSIAIGTVWTTASIVLTVVVSGICVVAILYNFFKNYNDTCCIVCKNILPD